MQCIPLITRKNTPAGNPGDVFIALGLQWLISRTVKNPAFLLLDKFDSHDFDEFLPTIRKLGYVIYAGTPQYNNYDDWCLWYDWQMYKDYLIPNHIRLHTLAAGSGFPDSMMSPVEFKQYCLQSQKTREILQARNSITGVCATRDLHAYELMKSFRNDVHLLPCTALWSGYWYAHPITHNNVVAFVPANPYMVNPQLLSLDTHEAVGQWQIRYYDQLKKDLTSMGYQVILICHGVHEFRTFRDYPECIYINELSTLLKLYASVDGVISLRLHGAIPVAGMGKKAVLIGTDTRQSAADLIGMNRIHLGSEHIGATAELYRSIQPCIAEELLSFEQRYIELLSSIFDMHMP